MNFDRAKGAARGDEEMYIQRGGKLVKVLEPLDPLVQAGENAEFEKRKSKQKEQVDAAIEAESKNVVATLHGEIKLLRARLEGTRAFLNDEDAKIKNPRNFTMVNLGQGGVEEFRAESIRAKQRLEDEALKLSAEIAALEDGEKAWLTRQYPGPEFVALIDRLEGEAAKQIHVYPDINDSRYKEVHSRLAGLAYIRWQLEQTQAKANPSSTG